MSLNRTLLTEITKKMSKPTKPKVPRNQWQHPGEITKINSSNITMQGVGFPVLGVPNVGQPQMMYPEQDYHFPEAGNVMEYPMMGGGGEMIRRADGSYSKRGLWDNIRANRGSGKKPTKEMLEQERKIKAEFGMELPMAQKGKQTVRDKNGYINIAKLYPEVGDNRIDKQWLEKAEMLNKKYPNSRFICTAAGCAEIATSAARAKGSEFGRNHAWLLGNQNSITWTNPNYEGKIGSGMLPNPSTYNVPYNVANLDKGYLVGLNRVNNKKGAPAMTSKEAKDSRDYANKKLFPNSRGYEHIGFTLGDGTLLHGTGAGKGHPAYMVFDNMKDGIKLNGVGRYEPVEVMEERGFFDRTANYFKNMFQKGGSIYDYMEAKGLNGSFGSRKKMFDKYFAGNYRGTAEQNQAMLTMLQGQQARPAAPRQVAPAPRAQAPAARTNNGMVAINGEIDNRNWFQRTLGMDEDEVQRYNFQVPQDVANYYNQYRDKNKGKKFGIVSKQNARGYFFDENGRLALEDEVGLGEDKGDAQPVFYKVKTTPSGEYTMNRAPNNKTAATDYAKSYGSDNFFYISHTDPNKRLIPDPANPGRRVTQAVHGVPVHKEKERLPKFNNNNVDDNRMSAGCINCRKQTLDNPYFTNIPQNMGLSLYVTPEKKNGGSTFSGNAWYKQGGQSNNDREMVNGIADILSQVQDPQNRAQIAANMIQDFKRQQVLYNPTEFMNMANLAMGGTPCFECGGSMQMGGQPQVGDEMEVTPEQMAELKRQGYTFEVI